MVKQQRTLTGAWKPVQEVRTGRHRASDDEAPTSGKIIKTLPVPSWNNSTTVVQLVRDSLVSQRWGDEAAPEIPCAKGSAELPQRPVDLGMGLWR